MVFTPSRLSDSTKISDPFNFIVLSLAPSVLSGSFAW